MKRYIGVFLGVIIALAMLCLFRKSYSEFNVVLKDDSLDYEVKFKGLKNAEDFVIDEKNNYYIAYKDRIQVIENSGKSYDLIKDKSLKIYSLDYKSEKLYFSSNNEIYCYDLSKDAKVVLIDNIPNFGDYYRSMLRIKNNDLLISVGAATNSGVVGQDNMWINSNPFYHDISPKDIILKGMNYGSEKTGAYVPYKTKNTSGQIVPGHTPGNASIVQFNLVNNTFSNFAWGIRNVNGMSFNSEGKLFAAVGGMEDRGLRPIKGDVDYIYEIKSGLWYGWPDYSGGDPVSSPRFKSDNAKVQSFILENHPTTNPPAPIYQHKQLSSIGSLEIDTKGVIGEKDCIYLYDLRDNVIYAFKKSGPLIEKVQLNKGMNVKKFKIYGNSMTILDSESGHMYNLYKKSHNTVFSINKNILYYLLLLLIAVISIIIWKFNFPKKYNN